MTTQTKRAITDNEPAVVTVDAAKLRELCDSYVLYRQTLTDPVDPVRVLTVTGDVLAAVRQVVTDPERGIRR